MNNTIFKILYHRLFGCVINLISIIVLDGDALEIYVSHLYLRI